MALTPEEIVSKIRDVCEQIAGLGPALQGTVKKNRNRRTRKDGSVYVSPVHYTFVYRGVDVSASKLRKMTLAFGEECVAEQQAPKPDVRKYTRKPAAAVKPVPRTLFCMADGGAANCCKVDTAGGKGKTGEAGTR